MPAAQQIFFWYFDEAAAGYYCPLNNYREIDPAGTAGYTYTNPLGTGMPLVGRTDNPYFTGVWQPPGPTEFGNGWQLKVNTAYRELQIEVNDPLVTMSNTIYFELFGAVRVEIDSHLQNNHATLLIDLQVIPCWGFHTATIADGHFIKRIRFKNNGTSNFGKDTITNVKLLCSEPPAYCPMDSHAIVDPWGIDTTPGLTIVAPGTVSNTNSATDYDGTPLPAYYYPQTQNGATESGPTYVIGNPLDTVKTLTVTVNDPAALKLDSLSFEADGSVRIEVWDEFANLAGAPTYQFDRFYDIPATFNFWWIYTCYPLIHPPIGADGNIKRVRLTALNPATGLPSGQKPTNIYRLQFGCANIVAKRTDVGQINPVEPTP